MIRKAVPEDLDAIGGILAETKRAMVEQGNPQWDGDYPNESTYAEDIRDGSLFVAECAGQVVGMAAFAEEGSEEYRTAAWTTPAPALTVHRLAVLPAFRNRGIAAMLMSEAESYARGHGYRSIRLDTFEKNKTAQAFFTRLGYARCGEMYRERFAEPYPCFEKAIVYDMPAE